MYFVPIGEGDYVPSKNTDKENEKDKGVAVEVPEPKPPEPCEGQSATKRSAKDLLDLTPHKLDSD